MDITQQQKEFLEVLQTQLGNVTLALNKTGISRDTYNGWLGNPTFIKGVKDVDERALDLVEQRLLSKINEGDLNAIQFYLKTKGKKRGY
jgi:RNA binding exosome subunit